MIHKLKGIIVPLITPLKKRDELDIPGLEKLINHVLKGGVHGVFILGTSGEAPSLSYSLRRKVIKETIRFVNNRVPVLVGITDTAIVESINLSIYAREEGVDAVVLAPPYYFPAAQPELIEYLESIIPDLALPVVLYNMPGLTKIWYEPDTILKMLKYEKVIAIKDSSGDMTYLNTLVYKLRGRDIPVLVGPEMLLAESILMGAQGGVSGGANMFPQLFVDIYQAALDKDMQRLSDLQEKVIKINDVIYSLGKYESRYIKTTKCVLSILGICNDLMAEPFNLFMPDDKKKMEAKLTLFKDLIDYSN